VSTRDHTEQNGTDGVKKAQDAGSLGAVFERQYCYVLAFGLIAKKPEKGWDKRNDAALLSREDIQMILRRIKNADGE